MQKIYLMAHVCIILAWTSGFGKWASASHLHRSAMALCSGTDLRVFRPNGQLPRILDHVDYFLIMTTLFGLEPGYLA